MDLLKVLLIITLASIPTGEVLRVEVTKEMGINLIDIFISITGLYGVFYVLKNRIKLLKYEKYFFGFIILCFVFLFINSKSLSSYQLLISFLYPLRFLLLFMIFSLIRIQKSEFKKILGKILTFAGLMIVLAGIVQYFLYPALRNQLYLGWDEHLYRLFSTFLDPNFTAVFIALFLFFILEKLRNSNTGEGKYLFALIFVVSFISLILTYSRGAILAFAITSLLYLFSHSYKKYLPVLFLLFALVISIMFVFKKSEGTDILRITSTQARLGSSLQAITIFKENPIFGVGFNAYRFALDRRFSKDNSENNFPSHSSGTDNSLLFVLATTGVVGFGAYLLFWHSIIIEKLRDRKSLDSQVAISSILLLFLSSFFVNALFYTPIMLWFFSSLAIKENN